MFVLNEGTLKSVITILAIKKLTVTVRSEVI